MNELIWGVQAAVSENKVMLKIQIAARADVSLMNVMDLSISCSISVLI
jgi:hypothetical protein